MGELQDFSNRFAQQVMNWADSTRNFTRGAVAELAGKWLEDEGEIENFSPAYYEMRGVPVVDGYSFSENEDAIDLFIVDHDPSGSGGNLTLTDATQMFNRLKNFFVQAATKNLCESLEESSAAYGLAWSLRAEARIYGRIRFFLISSRRLSSRVDSLDNQQIGDWIVSFHIWDIERLSRLHEVEREAIVINFREEFSRPLHCLPAHLDATAYKSYMVVLPGRLLADLYGKYGSRLLELNVRTFLQVRGNINKGIRRTIVHEPDMFFAYNNGISAVAEAIVTENQNGREELVSVRNLQIVNGGQTTASLYHAGRSKADLSGIFVQMKLSEVQPDLSSKVVPKISEYSNTQNKVSAADFFSNHAFHVRLEEMSRRLWVPAVDGSQRQSKWFYERARGQYAEAQSDKTKAQRDAWQREYPRAQLFTKTDLAKFDNVWDGFPVEVNLGAQKNFAAYARRISESWDKNDTTFNDRFYKRAVARGIVFKAVEKMVSDQPWYQGGYRANIVAYAQALLAEHIRRAGLAMNWDGIWAKQALSQALAETLLLTAEKVNTFITATPDHVRNVTEWCKRRQCWDGILEIPYVLPDALRTELLTRSEDKQLEKEAGNQRVMDNGIDVQATVVNKGQAYWAQVDDFCRKNKITLSPKERGVLDIAVTMPRRIPTERQCGVLVQLEKRAEGEGMQIPL
jgi:hypothetical protein